MKLLVFPLLFAAALAWPQQYVIEPVAEQEDPTFYETDLEADSQIDPGLIEDSGFESGLGLEEGGADDNVPDVLVVEEPLDRPEKPVVIYRQKNPLFSLFDSPFFSFKFGNRRNHYDQEREPDVGIFDEPIRRTRPQSPFDMFHREFFRPTFNPFPSIFIRRRPVFHSFDVPEELPRETGVPDSETGASDPDGDFLEPTFENEPETEPQPLPERRPFSPFFHHFSNVFDNNFGFGAPNFFGFPKDLPENYDNSTYRVEDVNGTKVAVNETIKKKTGDNFNTFFHFKVIRKVPEDKPVEEQPLDEDIPEEVFPTDEIPLRSDVKPIDEGYVNEPYVPVEEENQDTTFTPESFGLEGIGFGNPEENEIDNNKPVNEPTV